MEDFEENETIKFLIMAISNFLEKANQKNIPAFSKILETLFSLSTNPPTEKEIQKYINLQKEIKLFIEERGY